MAGSALINDAHARRDGLILLGFSALLMGVGSLVFGVWEPWEADRARLLDALADRSWLEVVRPLGEQKVAPVPELPYGWWPLRASTGLLGVTELGLRLPGLICSLAVLGLMHGTTRRLYGRLAANLAVLAALATPLFAFHGRHGMGLGVEAGLMSLGALGLIRSVVDPEARPWAIWVGWLGAACSGLAAGLPGLAPPVIAGLTAWWMSGEGRKDALKGLLSPAPVALAITLVGAGWVMALNATDSAWTSMLLWLDPLEPASRTGITPTFETFVHQLGFGLFPIGALIPFAFGALLWADPPEGEPGARAADPAVAAWFAAAFLGPALAVPATRFGLFPGAAAVAVAVGVYLTRVLKSKPEPVMVVGTVLVLALLDSNLKHDTRYLAETLVGVSIDTFPDKLRFWSLARLLSVGLLGALALYQAGLWRHVGGFVHRLAYPRRLDGPTLWVLAGLSVVLAFVITKVIPGPFDALVDLRSRQWLRLVVGVRSLIVLVGLAVVLFGLLAGAVKLRIKQLGSRTEGRAARWAERLGQAVGHPTAGALVFAGILGAWGLFYNVPVAVALTQNFSEKHLLSRYKDFAEEGEDLFAHRLRLNTTLFYARDMARLSPTDFAQKAASETRFFALIPRDKLADVNTAFRRATQRTLPVLDETSERFLLISNQHKEGEPDFNPIKQALVKEVPEGVHKVSVNFDDRVELVGWQLVPDKPKRGAPLEMVFYWKALKEVPGNYKVFVHIDAAGSRIHGDHDPVAGLYPTSNWTPGDIVRDAHTVNVKGSTSRVRHTFFVGLFRGSKRMPIKSGPKDNQDRARIGYVTVR